MKALRQWANKQRLVRVDVLSVSRDATLEEYERLLPKMASWLLTHKITMQKKHDERWISDEGDYFEYGDLDNNYIAVYLKKRMAVMFKLAWGGRDG